MGNQTPQTFGVEPLYPAGGRPTVSTTRTGGMTHTGAPDSVHKGTPGSLTHAAVRTHRAALPKPTTKPHTVKSAHKTTGSPKIAHKSAVIRPKPKPKPKPKAPAHPAATKPAPKAAGVSVPTNSPAPASATPDTGGLFGGLDLFPLLLLAGGALALWWLFMHRKGGRGAKP